MNPKILLIADFAHHGGTRTCFDNLLDFYEKMDYTVYYAIEKQILKCSNFRLDTDRFISIPEQLFLTQPGFFNNFFGIGYNFFKKILLTLTLLREIKKKNIDLIVVSTGCIDRYLPVFALPVPCLYINHTNPAKSVFDPLIQLFLKLTHNSRKRIISNTDNMKDIISKLWGSPVINDNIDIIRYGVQTFHPDSVQNPIDPHKPQKTILTVGHVNWYKNPEMWIQVAERVMTDPRCKEYHWVWAGDGDLLEYCREIVKDKNLHNIFFIGYYSDLESLYRDSVIYFQPSILESFGLSALDAMQMGVPCVVTRVGGLPELIIDGETGFTIDEGDVENAAQKISWLLSHQEEREEMGKAGYNNYRKNYSKESWINQMKELHQTILLSENSSKK